MLSTALIAYRDSCRAPPFSPTAINSIVRDGSGQFGWTPCTVIVWYIMRLFIPRLGRLGLAPQTLRTMLFLNYTASRILMTPGSSEARHMEQVSSRSLPRQGTFILALRSSNRLVSRLITPSFLIISTSQRHQAVPPTCHRPATPQMGLARHSTAATSESASWDPRCPTSLSFRLGSRCACALGS